MYEIGKRYDFCASHVLRGHPGPCGRLHGHNYRLEVRLAGETLDDLHMLLDFYELDAVVKPLIDAVDHRHLNDLPPFASVNPTAEAIAAWFHRELVPGIREASSGRARLCGIRLWETPDACVTFTEE